MAKQEEQGYVLVAEDRTQVKSGDEVGKLNIVKNIDDKGKVETVAPQNRNKGDFMHINTSKDFLENFIDNFLKNFNNYRNMRLYKVKSEDVEKEVAKLKQQLENPEKNRVDLKDKILRVSDLKEKPQITEQLEQKLAVLGLTKEKLEQSGQLEKLLDYQYTDVIDLNVHLGGGVNMQARGRIALRTNRDTGEFEIKTRTVQKEIDLHSRFYGEIFDEVDRINLATKGNLGRLAQLKGEGGVIFGAYVAVDPQTNHLVYTPANRVHVPKKVSGVTLSEEERNWLVLGKPVYVEGMTSKSGKKFNATLQIDAFKKRIDYQFVAKKMSQQQTNTRKDGIPYTINDKEITKAQQDRLASGKSLYLKGMISSTTGRVFNAYVTFDKGKGRITYSRFNPEESKQSDIIKQARRTPKVDVSRLQNEGQSQAQNQNKGRKL